MKIEIWILPKYPVKAPTYWSDSNTWKNLNKAFLSGIVPQSIIQQYLGFNTSQNPLKNHIYEDTIDFNKIQFLQYLLI